MLLQIANARIEALKVTPELLANNELVMSVFLDTTKEDQIQSLQKLGEALVLSGERTTPFSEQQIEQARWQRFFVVTINPRTIIENEYIFQMGELVD